MGDHSSLEAPHSSKPYLRLNYYDYQEWLQIISTDRLTKWEIIAFKDMHESYTWGRAFLQIPAIGISYGLASYVFGPSIRRGSASFRENFIFGVFVYAYLHHNLDSKRIPNPHLDALFTQSSPNGAYIRRVTREYMPGFWQEIEEQLQAKGLDFSNEA